MKISILATAAILTFSTGALFANPAAVNGGQSAKAETGIVSTDAENVHQNKVVSHKSHKHSARAHHKKTAKSAPLTHKHLVKNATAKKSQKVGQTKLGQSSSK